jgi:hypothetical protein
MGEIAGSFITGDTTPNLASSAFHFSIPGEKSKFWADASAGVIRECGGGRSRILPFP